MASAIAIGGGPADNACTFPMVLPDCAVANAALDDTCSMCLKMGPANQDNVGWTSFGNGNDPNDIATAIAVACFANGLPSVNANGECTGPCSNNSQVQKQLQLNGGNFFNSNNSKKNPSPCEVIVQILNRDGAAKPFTVKVPVVDTGVTASNCGAATLNGNGNTISGFTLVDIYEASCGQGPNAVSAKATIPNPPDCGSPVPGNNYLRVSLHKDPVTNTCDSHPTHDHAGGGFFGVSGEPRLVQ
jgi:hypothetical protein